MKYKYPYIAYSIEYSEYTLICGGYTFNSPSPPTAAVVGYSLTVNLYRFYYLSNINKL